MAGAFCCPLTLTVSPWERGPRWALVQDGYAHLPLALGEGTKRAGVLEFGVPRESDVPSRPIASFPPRIRVRGRLRRESRVPE